MPIAIKMPALSPTMEEGKLAKWLKKEGDKVKITVLFRSREITRPEMGQKVMEFFSNGCGEVGVVEKAPTMEGRTMTMVLAPKPKGK